MAGADDHGLGAPVPDENTPVYELYAVLQEAINTFAGIIAAQIKQLPEDVPTNEQLRDSFNRLAARLLAAEQNLARMQAPPAPPAVDQVARDAVADLQLRLAQTLRTAE